ncbi:conjugal transfer pilin subunit TraA [Klebsiella pneumoniae]|nr:conjugal transfer pilin subunit TraA [Klebsiella pneumoniae]
MNAVLSVQGSAVSEKTKPSFMSRVFNKKKALKVAKAGNDSNLMIVFYVQIMPDDLVMQLHRF